MEEIYNAPRFYAVLTNRFGDRTQVEIDLEDETADCLVEGFRRFMLAAGYQPETVKEVLPSEFDLLDRDDLTSENGYANMGH